MTPKLVYPDPALIDLLRAFQGGTLPPWEAYRWFDTPVETLIPSAILPAPALIVGRNVRRVVLMIDTLTGADATVSLQGQRFDQGILVTKSRPPFILTQGEHALLVQEDWFCTTAAMPQITVTEVFLRAWPGGDPIG